MIFNYMKISLRNLLKHKLFSIINIFGLALGLAATFLILFWVQHERSFDSFHPEGKRIFRVMSYGTKYMKNGFEGTPAPLGPALKKQIPEVEEYVRIAGLPRYLFRHRDRILYENLGIIADPTLLSMFHFPMMQGDVKKALLEPLNIVITEAMARRYFGNQPAVGQTIQIEDQVARVTGVLKNIHLNSHIRFDYVSSFQFGSKLSNFGRSWGSFNFVTYIKIKPGTDPANLARKITDLARDAKCPQVADGVQFRLQPLASIHLDSRGHYRNFYRLADGKYIFIFSIIAFFILFIAWANYTNLSTSISSVRTREVGLRKTIGAQRKQLMGQFLTESMAITLVAAALAIIMVILFLPHFSRITGKYLPIGLFHSTYIIGFSVIILLSGLGAGFYPALLLTRSNPARVITPPNPKRGKMFRRFLVVTQFIIAIILISATITVYRQIHYVRSKNLGFNKDHVVYIPIKDNIGKQYQAFKNQLLQDPYIQGVSAQYYLFAESGTFRTTNYHWTGRDPDHQVDMVLNLVDYDFFKILDIKFASGRAFSKKHPTDASQAYILNQEAIRKMGIRNPIGHDFAHDKREGKIIGIINDTHFNSLHRRIEPYVFWILENPAIATQYGKVLIRIDKENVSRGLAAIRRAWQKFNPLSPFEYNFLDRAYENNYKKERQTATILNLFTILALVICCLGLLGLTSFTAEQRTKEIGIRKVMGATVNQIITLLARDFFLWILLANVLAWPVAYLIMQSFLNNFAYHTTMGLSIFLLASLMVLVIAVCTIAYKTNKTARANPVQSLRYE